MKTKPINVIIIDDEFPKIQEFREKGIYNSVISKENLYHLAVNSDWQHLIDLKQLILNIVTSDANHKGLINLMGFSTPTQLLSELKKGLLPDVIIYDWEYPNAPMQSPNSKNWLLNILNETQAFVFVYSKMRNEIPKFLNHTDFSTYADKFQLFLKGGKIKSSFSAEEFIFQYIMGLAIGSCDIQINGIKIEFSSNSYLKSASDILFLQRILGSQHVLDELEKIEFRLNELGVEKILDDSERYLLFSKSKRILFSPNENINDANLGELQKLKYSEVIKNFSINILEDTLERGFLVL